MPSKNTRRGFHPDDPKLFSGDSMKLLQKAQLELQWLLDKGYNISPASEFIGNHYQFALRQRIALRRATAQSPSYRSRADCLIASEHACDGPVFIDGFNLIVTLEVALSGSPVILCGDGTLRDLAGLRGTYRLIDRTDQALDLIGRSFSDLSIPEATFYLDAPVSNSGRLKKRILETSQNWHTNVQVKLVPNADTVLAGMERVVTCDSAIIDSCVSWVNLTSYIVNHYIGNAWIVRLISDEKVYE